MSTGSTAKVGSFVIEVSPEHIYLTKELPQTYDYVPWNIIAAVLDEAGLSDCRLIDVGANVGDSLAHFRRFSANPAVCIEPSAEFFSILERNALQFGDVTLVNRLMVPGRLKGRVEFVSDQQTGSSRIAVEPDKAWSGDTVSFADLGMDTGRFVVKTDTDGFDDEIVADLLDTIAPRFDVAPVIFFEGPAEWQFIGGALDAWLDVIARLQANDYQLLILTNRGRPYLYAGTDREAARSAIVALQMGHARSHALCHYYDFIAVHSSVRSRIIQMQSPWPTSIFDRR